MLGAIVSLLLVVAAAYAVTQVGGVITLLFIAAVLFLAYRRLSLLAFTTTFTVLLAAYTERGPAGAEPLAGRAPHRAARGAGAGQAHEPGAVPLRDPTPQRDDAAHLRDLLRGSDTV